MQSEGAQRAGLLREPTAAGPILQCDANEERVLAAFEVVMQAVGPVRCAPCVEPADWIATMVRGPSTLELGLGVGQPEAAIPAFEQL